MKTKVSVFLRSKIYCIYAVTKHCLCFGERRQKGKNSSLYFFLSVELNNVHIQETEDENTTKTQQSFYLCKLDQHWTINQFLPITITACL